MVELHNGKIVSLTYLVDTLNKKKKNAWVMLHNIYLCFQINHFALIYFFDSRFYFEIRFNLFCNLLVRFLLSNIVSIIVENSLI